jgi:serine/threonine protein kinase
MADDLNKPGTPPAEYDCVRGPALPEITKRIGDVTAHKLFGAAPAGGAVEMARQVTLDRLVALKTLQAPIAVAPECIARFRREAKAAVALNHPNLIQVHSTGETDGLHWFAMEYVGSESAQGRLKRKGPIELVGAIS